MSHTSVSIVFFCTLFFYNFTVSQSKFRKLESMQNRLQSQLNRLEEKVFKDELDFRDDLDMILKQLNNSNDKNQDETAKFSDIGFTSMNDDKLLRVLQKVRTYHDGLGKEKQYIRNQLKLFEVALDDMKRQQAKTISEFVEKSDKRLVDIEKQVSVRKESIDRKVIDMNNKTAWITKIINDNMDIVNTSQNALKHEIEELKETIAGNKEVMAELSEKLENVDEAIKKIEIETSHLTCPDGWIAHKWNCYLVGSTRLTFKKAHDFCTGQEAHLVRIEDSLENEFLRQMLKTLDVPDTWIGMTDQREEGVWRWYGTNERVTFSDWGSGEPNNSNNEDCAAIRTLEADWNDFDCTTVIRPLCEK